MNDQRLERRLRTTLAARADTITSAPPWDGDLLHTAPARRRYKAWWIAPLAAAATVIAVVASVLALRGGSPQHHTPPAVGPPIPDGMQAVDALGIEIFVPSNFQLDAQCGGDTVLRPVPRPAVWCPGPTPGLGSTSVAIAVPPAAPVPGPAPERDVTPVPCALTRCEAGKRLDQPAVFVVTANSATATVNVTGPDRALAIKIVQSAHAVPVDRNGCAAARYPVRAARHNDPSQIGGPSPLPGTEHVTSMGVCWYLSNRLGASAALDATDAAAVARAAPDARALFGPYAGRQPAQEPCSGVDTRDGVVLITHYADGTSSQSILSVAACPGRNPGTPGASFVTDLGRRAHMPLTLGYST